MRILVEISHGIMTILKVQGIQGKPSKVQNNKNEDTRLICEITRVKYYLSSLINKTVIDGCNLIFNSYKRIEVI